MGKTAWPLKQNEYKLIAVGIPAQFRSTLFSWKPIPSNAPTHATEAMRMMEAKIPPTETYARAFKLRNHVVGKTNMLKIRTNPCLPPILSPATWKLTLGNNLSRLSPSNIMKSIAKFCSYVEEDKIHVVTI
jgi:hypothetical protein